MSRATATRSRALLLLLGLASLVASGIIALEPLAKAGTNGAVSYEADCTTSLQAGTVAPFVIGLNTNAAPDPSSPTGASFGATGTATLTIIGPVVAGLQTSPVASATLGASVSATIGSTDGTATGTFAYSHTFPAQASTGTTLSATAASGSTTLSGNFTSSMIGDGVAGTGIATGTVITAVASGTSATISPATTAAVTSVTLWSSLVFSDSGFSTGSSAFTTSGTAGSKANIGVISVTSVALAALIPLTFGGTAGTGTADCLETGWQDATHPGPAQTGETAPALPFGSTTALVSASPLRFQPAAFVSLSGGSSTTSSTSPSSTSSSTPSSSTTSVVSTSTTTHPTSTTSSTSTSTSTSTTSTSTTTTSTIPPANACLPYCHGAPPTVAPFVSTTTTSSGSPSTATGPAITVSPSTGLKDGQSVTISGTGFPPNDALVAIECSPLAATASNAENDCDIGAANLGVHSDGSGAVHATLTVHTGSIGSDSAAICPPASGNCAIAVSELSATSSVRATADISFAGQTSGGSTTPPSGGNSSSGSGSAPTGPTITVSPSTGLTDGQTVQISGSGFPANDALVAIECSPLALTAGSPANECDVAKANLAVQSDASGSISTTLTVHTGVIGTDSAAVCPPTSGNCAIAVSELSPTSSVRATANIVFAGQTSSASENATAVGARVLGNTISRSPASGLPLTGSGKWTIAVALLAVGLVDLGYLAVSATWPRRRTRTAPMS